MRKKVVAERIFYECDLDKSIGVKMKETYRTRHAYI